jgi:hypothetical protein
MTHAQIISHIYSNQGHYHELWNRHAKEAGELGAFVFLPGKGLDWEWWAVSHIREYIRQGGLDDVELLDGLKVFDRRDEFLVLVIEHVDGPGKQEAHFHRMSKARMN